MLDFLASIVGEDGLLTEPSDSGRYLTDALGLHRGTTLAVARPRSVAEVSKIVKLCSAEQVAITPHGGGTGFCGGAVPSPGRPNVVLSLERMRRIRAIDQANDAIVAEAGCTLSQVRQAAFKAGRLFPISHGGEGAAQIGGMIATNAGGTNVVRYGMTRSQVLGLEVVLADGAVWNGLRMLRKDNAGYDLKQLFIGAEGTLGIVTAASLALQPRPIAQTTALAAVADLKAAHDLYLKIRAGLGELVSAVELIPRSGVDLHFARLEAPSEPFAERHDWMLLIELETAIPMLDARSLLEGSLTEALEARLVRDALVARSETQRSGLWRLREGMADVQACNPMVLKNDTSVPLGAVPEFVHKAGLAVSSILPEAIPIPFGHIGDGNIHYNVMAPMGCRPQLFAEAAPRLAEAIETAALSLGGSIAAEHGLGQSKRDKAARTKSETELDVMWRVKTALDPKSLFNPGKVLTDRL